MRILEPEELAHLVSAIEPQYSALILTAANTGCRFNELAALRTEHLDASRRQFVVAETLTARDGPLGPVPLRESRQISVPGELVEELGRHFALWPPGPSRYLFASPRGGLLRRSNFHSRVWLPAVELSVGEPLRFQDLRHTYAATLLAAGEHPKVLQLRLGHATLQVTLEQYAHLLDVNDVGRTDQDYLATFGSYLEMRATRYSPAVAPSV